MENKLNELNIFALRDFARRTGVSSPTSKKKEQLIREIKEILSGEKKPVVAKSKQGRPPKVFGYDVTSVFNESFLNLNEITTCKTLNQKSVDYQASGIVTVAGWLEPVNNNSALLWVEKNYKNEIYFVPNEVLKNFNFKMGDRVVAEVSMDENQKIVKEIFSINDCPIMKFSNKRNDYEKIAHNIPNQNVDMGNLNNLKICFGENVFVYGEDNKNNTIAMVELLNNSKIENKLYVNISLSGKSELLLQNLNNAEKFVANIMDDEDASKRVVMLAVERAKRILEIGENVLLVVDDIASILGIDKVGLNLVKNLVSVAKAGKSGSITLVAVMPHNNFNQIEKLADRRIVVENQSLILK